MAPKRKRAASAATKDAPTTEQPPQPSSRDASGEDTADPILEDVKERKSMDPPAKRTRASSAANGTKSAAGAAGHKKGDSSASRTSTSTTAGEKMSIDTGRRVEMPKNAAESGGEQGEAGTMRMEAPPKAGLVDPAGGYKTNPPPEGRSVRVYADGVFDLFHLGHARVLQQAKMAFPDTYLIVGVTGDNETYKRKGLTVMSAKERAESVRHCRWVDEVVEDCPWVIDIEFLEKHKIDYVAHDDLPYAAKEGDDVYAPIKEKGMFLVTQRTEGVSTTGIITKIVRDYEQYISRQLKRGTSRQELNVSWLKKNQLDIKRHVSELRETIQNNWTTTGRELSNEFRQFWQPSRPNSPAPSARTARTATPSRLSVNGTPNGRDGTPSGSTKGRNNTDFAAGYAMGLIGGVKGWMEGSRRRNLSDSRAVSPDDSAEERSPVESEAEGSRGRGRQSERERILPKGEELPHS